MAFGQCGLDRRLAFHQPVQCGVELVLIDATEPEHFAEARCGGRRRKRTRDRELGGGIEDAADQQGKNEIATAVAISAENTIEADPSRGAQRRGDVAVRQAADDREGVALGGYHRAAFEHAAQPLDVGGRPVGEVAQRALTDLAVLAIALAQQDGRR